MVDTRRAYNIVFVVCHPDDEALWVGGLIHGLSTFAFLRVFVVCLSGLDPDSPREAEFHEARERAGYAGGVVLGGKLRPATEPLPPTSETTEEGLRCLGLSRADVDVLITHSPYGDEHTNPHHRQTYQELLRWSREHDVPFGYFTCIPIPLFMHQPLLRSVKRRAALHLLSFSGCAATPALTVSEPDYHGAPDYYVQFLTDMETKQRILECYQSIDLAEHAAGYAAFTSSCESLYLFGERALSPFAAVIEEMEIPGGVADLFPSNGAIPRGPVWSALRRVVPVGIRRAIRNA